MQMDRPSIRRADSVASVASTFETLNTGSGTDLRNSTSTITQFPSRSSDSHYYASTSPSSIRTSFTIPDIDPYQCYPSSAGQLDQVAPWELQARRDEGRRRSICETEPRAQEKSSGKSLFGRFSNKQKRGGKDAHPDSVELDEFLARTTAYNNQNFRNIPLPPTPVASTFNQLDLYAAPRRQSVSHPNTPNSSSFFKIRTMPSMPRLYQKENTTGAVKLVVKQPPLPSANIQASTSSQSAITEAEAQSIFTTITTSSSGSSADIIIPYGRGGAGRAVPKVHMHTKVYGSTDALMSEDRLESSETGPGKSGGKVFIEGLFTKGGRSRKNANSSHATGLDGIGSKNKSNDTIATVRSVLPPPEKRMATFGRGGAGKVNRNTVPKKPQPPPMPDVPDVIPTGDDFVPTYGRGGAARQKKKKPTKA